MSISKKQVDIESENLMEIISEENFIKRYGACISDIDCEEGLAVDFRYYLAKSRLEELAILYNTGRSFLIDAVNTDEWYEKQGLDDKISIIWNRHTKFLVSALLISHCMDYFLKIIWTFASYEEPPKEQDTYKKWLKACDYPKIQRTMKSVEWKELQRIWQLTNVQFRQCQKLRKQIVNVLKHEDYIFCSDIKVSSPIVFRFCENSDSRDSTTEMPKDDHTDNFVKTSDFQRTLSLQEEEKIIFDAFKGIRPLIEEYNEFLKVDKFFESQNGNILLCEPKFPYKIRKNK